MNFYTKTFGWKFDKWEGDSFDYWFVTAGQAPELGIDGGMGLKATSYAGLIMRSILKISTNQLKMLQKTVAR